MKKRPARKKAAKASVKHSSKKHTCFLSYCVCKHPSFIISVVVLVLAVYGAIYLMLTK